MAARGSYPLAPYSNRIRDGVFTFDGARHRLRSLAGRSEAIHGSGLYLPWQVRALEADSVDLVLDAPAGTMGWPGRSNACSAIGWMPAA